MAEQESFTRAATKLGIRQSALSRQIQRLERELDTLLFYRNGRGVRLTTAGEKIQRVGKTIFESLNLVTEEIQAERSKLRGVVSLGLPPSLGATITAGVVRRFQESYPEACIKVCAAFSGTLLEWLDAGRIDVGVLYDVHRSRTLLVTPLLQEYLHLISAPGAEGTAEIAELGVGSYIMPASVNGMRRIVDAAISHHEIKMRITAEIDSLDAMKEIVETTANRCVLPFGAVHREVKAGRLSARRFNDPQMQALIVMATPLHRPVTRLASVVLQLVEKEVSRCVDNNILSGLAGWELRKTLAEYKSQSAKGGDSVPPSKAARSSEDLADPTDGTTN